MTRYRRIQLDLVALTAVILIAAALLSPLLNAGFMTDDFHLMHVANVALDGEAGLSWHDAEEFLKYFWLQASPNFELYRPSVLLSFGLNSTLNGHDPFPFQLTNLCLHLLAAIMVFALLRTLFPGLSLIPIGLATLLFAVSPLQIEVAAWSAARSETLSLIFGFAALTLKARNPSRVILPLLFVALSLTAKESALAFLPALLALDLRRTRPSKTTVQRLLAEVAPLVALFLLYAILRLMLFGRVFGAYGHKTVQDYLSFADYGLNVMRSISVLGVPISFVAYGDSLWRTPIIIASVLGVASLGTQFLTPDRRKKPRSANKWLGVILLSLPLLLGVLVNPVTHFLVGTRALYTPVAGLTICLVAGVARSRGWIRYLPIACLLGTALLTNRASQQPHLESTQRIRHTLESLWTPLAQCQDVPHDRVAILDYSEQTYFNDSFDMSNALEKAIGTPFLPRDVALSKVSSRPGEEIGTVSLADCLLQEGDGLILFSMTTDATGERTCSLISAGAFSWDSSATVTLRHPRHGGDLTLRPGMQSVPHLSFLGREIGDAESMTLTVLNSNGAFPGFTKRLSSLPSKPASDGTEWRFDIPEKWFPKTVAERTTLGWFVDIHDAKGDLLARSPVGCFFLTIE